MSTDMYVQKHSASFLPPGHVNRIMTIALVGLPILFSATAAIADDAKTHPGAMCQTALNTVPFGRDNNGRMTNLGTVNQIWICPIVRDTMAADSGEFVGVTTLAEPRVQCTLNTRSDRGTDGRSFSGVDEVTGDTRRSRYATGDENFGGVANGYYYLLCQVPPGGGVVSYQWEEDE
jgi:hypothetical protein